MRRELDELLAADAAVWDGVPAEHPPTGDDAVDGALRALQAVRGSPIADHVPVYEDVHRRLHDALADLGGS
jgi:hypothetical protein